MMTVAELIEALQDYDEEAEVRLMTQQNYPFENALQGVTDSEEIRHTCDHEDCDCDLDECDDPDCPDCQEQDTVVFLVEGNQLGYGNKNAWNLC